MTPLKSIVGELGCRVFFILLLTIALISSGCSGGGDSGDDSFEDGPVEIPVTIAKGIDGIDPSTVEFDADTGVLSACTEDLVDSDIWGIVDGEVECNTETTDGCFECTDIDPPIVISLVAANATGTAVSYPVTVTISSGGTITGIAVLNVGDLSSLSKIAVKSDGTVAFVANNSSGNPVIGTTTTMGGSPTIFASIDDSSAFQLIGYAGDNLITYNSTSGEVASYNSSAEKTALGTAVNANVKIGPNNEVAFMTAAATVSIDGTEVTNCPNAGVNVASMLVDWYGATTLFAVETRNDGSLWHERCPNVIASSLIAGGVFNKFLSETAMTDCAHVTCNGDGSCFVECGVSSEVINVFRYDADNATLVGPLVSVDVVSGTSLVNSDGTRLHLAFDDGEGECDNSHMQYDVTNGRTIPYERDGCSFFPDPDDNTDAIYICELEGESQVCFVGFDSVEELDGDESCTPTKLVLSGPTDIDAWSCTEAYTVSSTDSYGNDCNVSADTTINLTGESGGDFYSDSDCINDVTTRIINSGSSSTTFYFFDVDDEDLTFRAEDNAGTLDAATLGVTSIE